MAVVLSISACAARQCAGCRQRHTTMAAALHRSLTQEGEGRQQDRQSLRAKRREADTESIYRARDGETQQQGVRADSEQAEQRTSLRRRRLTKLRSGWPLVLPVRSGPAVSRPPQVVTTGW